MNSWLGTYRKKISRRNLRIKGFGFRFFIPRYLKSLLLLPSVAGLLSILFLGKHRTILYRPDARHLHLFQDWSKVLVIGSYSDARWANKQGYDFFHFSPIYTACNFGFSPWRLLLRVTGAKRVFVATDYGLDQYLAIFASAETKLKVWCVQHGLFPASNNQDLDGLDAHVNIVASIFQEKILRQAGYKGKIIVEQRLFQRNSASQQFDGLLQWNANGRKVVFVGAGYNHDPAAEERIFDLILKLKESLPACILVYRPHPRDSAILKKLATIGLQIERDEASAIEGDKNLVFIGIKSTYLLEAQNFGKCAILVTGESIARYFEPGEIAFEISDRELPLLIPRLESYFREADLRNVRG
jgi:hypothetical protein